jgi:hypothetical protein
MKSSTLASSMSEDKRDERRVVHPCWGYGQGVRPIIVNGILALIMLGNK